VACGTHIDPKTQIDRGAKIESGVRSAKASQPIFFQKRTLKPKFSSRIFLFPTIIFNAAQQPLALRHAPAQRRRRRRPPSTDMPALVSRVLLRSRLLQCASHHCSLKVTTCMLPGPSEPPATLLVAISTVAGLRGAPTYRTSSRAPNTQPVRTQTRRRHCRRRFFFPLCFTVLCWMKFETGFGSFVFTQV